MAEKTSWELIESEVLLAGLRRQMLNGEKITLGRMQFEAGTKVPRHQHANEQITIIAEGTMLLTLDDREITLGKGEMILIPVWDGVAFLIWSASFLRSSIRWRGADYYIREGQLVAKEEVASSR